MGPIRGQRKKRRVDSSRAETDAAMAPQLEAGDWWLSFKRRIAGPLSLPKGLDGFESVFKISRRTFNYICSLVRDDLMSKTSKYTFSNGKVLCIEDQVAVALRRLSSGNSLFNVGVSFGMNQSTVSHVTWRFVEAMEERGFQHLRWPNSLEELKAIKSKFGKICGLPNCCGAIDTTHIVMCIPTTEPSSKVWLDQAKNYSMVMQAIVDPEMRFRDIATGWPGCMDEYRVLSDSGFLKLCQKGVRLNGEKIQISKGSDGWEDPGVREYIIGDGAFPLLPWLLTPYQGRELSECKSEFNRRHLATRMVAQRALARLKDMWKIIQGEMWMPDKHRLPRIILVCCLLHNIIIDLEDEVRDEMPLSHHHDEACYKQRFCDFADKEGIVMRDKLSRYLSGRIPP